MNHNRIERPITSHRAMGTDTGPPRRDHQPFLDPTRTPRLLLRESGARPGEVDGAWWPWTANLTAELHDLISVLTPRLGSTVDVGFDWNSTSRNQRRIDHDDGVRIHGSAADQPAGVIRLIGAQGVRLNLRVIACDTPADQAHTMLLRAAAPEAGA